MAIAQKAHAISSNRLELKYSSFKVDLDVIHGNVSQAFVSKLSTLPDSDTPSAEMTVHATEETHRPTLQKRISTVQTNNI